MAMDEDFWLFLKQIPEGTPGVRIGRLTMSYLMRKQYGNRPPNPCPCYTPN